MKFLHFTINKRRYALMCKIMARSGGEIVIIIWKIYLNRYTFSPKGLLSPGQISKCTLVWTIRRCLWIALVKVNTKSPPFACNGDLHFFMTFFERSFIFILWYRILWIYSQVFMTSVNRKRRYLLSFDYFQNWWDSISKKVNF